jgi:hypothetical protein
LDAYRRRLPRMELLLHTDLTSTYLQQHPALLP